MKLKVTCLFFCAMFFLSACSDARWVDQDSNGLHKSRISMEMKEAVPVSFFPDPVQIVSIGDSLTQGVGDSTNQGGYLPYLRKKLEKEPEVTAAYMINHGKRGNRTDQLLTRLDGEKMKEDIQNAECIIITIGGNDVIKIVRDHISNLTMDQFTQAKTGYKERLIKIMDKVRLYNQDADIYLVGLYNPFSNWLSNFRELDTIMYEWDGISREVVTNYSNAYFIEIGDIFKNTQEDLLFDEDLFHPNDRGYEMIASRIYGTMESNRFGENSLEASAKKDEE
ncbi:SGNH/GDSL hydrolase family protein [Bacillus sp. V5-8f]|uniref:SGNH/GDSL hydrolase family protein n=1 Tax=Bacillus sp. V5-8f TaxID=2053044 RepID=UPI0015E0B034|nr:SGNH/GDSL hydrolase family protein [Bacillus sp. V5-8f]